MNSSELVPHLFRTEYSKIAAVLSRHFGLGHIEVAEDIASETFLAALESWSFKGVPDNPAAWLYAVAKNRARNHVARTRRVVEVGGSKLDSLVATIDFSPENIEDSQLRMIFAVCHPAIPPESQVGLALRILCGFGIEEIADAFFTNKETINKRLFRAKETLRRERINLDEDFDVEARLPSVLATLYLLFSEGYYSESQNEVLREDLCHEAMRLTELLLGHEQTNHPETCALLALMYFHASRFKARKDASGELVLYADQDESLWDQSLIARGAQLLNQASGGTTVTKYHLEASIAYWHTVKEDTPQKWETVLMLHNHLLQLEYSPMAALNRTYALARVKGNEVAIAEAERLQLTNNHFYFTLLGELYTPLDPAKAKHNFEQALALAKTPSDRRTIEGKIRDLVV